MTKYGLEEIIGQEYPNNMPAYKDILTDEDEVVESLPSDWAYPPGPEELVQPD